MTESDQTIKLNLLHNARGFSIILLELREKRVFDARWNGTETRKPLNMQSQIGFLHPECITKFRFIFNGNYGVFGRVAATHFIL